MFINFFGFFKSLLKAIREKNNLKIILKRESLNIKFKD